MSGLTKILIVLQLVFSLALSILLVLMVSRQENYKDQLAAHDTGLITAEVTINSLRQQLADLTSKNEASLASVTTALTAQQTAANALAAEKTRLTNELQRSKLDNDSQKLQISSLTSAVQSASVTVEQQRKDLNDLQAKITPLITQNGEIGRKNSELETQVRMADAAIRKLQEDLEAQKAAPKPTTSANASTGASDLAPPNLMANPINGQIVGMASQAGRTYIETKLGTRDGVKENSRLAIYRGNTYVGDAVVQKATVDGSVAVILTVKPGEAVQKGDLVMGGD